MSEPRPIALVTGAARRVGRAIALGLGAHGYDVLVHYRHSREEAEATVAALRAGGAEAAALRADLASVPEIESLFGAIAERPGRLDLLVNNASTFRRTPFGDVREEDWDELHDANLKAPFFCCQFAAPLLARSDRGQIVNLVDTSAARPWTGYLPYCSAKAGLRALTLGLARALAPRVRVNAVAPGPVLLPEGTTPAERRAIEDSTLLRRLGSPQDVAEAVLFLATGPAYLTGAILPVDGGQGLH